MNKKIQTRKGILFIISGPSGVGKGTVRERVLEDIPDLLFSVSVTTRKRRPHEIEGKDYIFIDKPRFEQMIENGELLEWALVYDNYYGTPRAFIENALREGKDVLLEIDIQGAQKVKKEYPDAVSIFLAPPSIEELINRLKKRATETEEEFRKRIEKAEKEMRDAIHYDYLVINDKIDNAIMQVKCVILAERVKIVKVKEGEKR